MISLAGWIGDFCQLHERAKQRALTAQETVAYRQGRDDLASTLLVAQRIALGGKAGARLAIRVTQAHQLELDLPLGTAKVVTLDIAVGGLSTIVASAPEKGATLGFRLKLSRGVEVSGSGQVVYVERQDGSAKIALRFDDMSPDDRTTLEDAVFDAVVAQLRLLPRRT